jgi:hypothetical protein
MGVLCKKTRCIVILVASANYQGHVSVSTPCLRMRSLDGEAICADAADGAVKNLASNPHIEVNGSTRFCEKASVSRQQPPCIRAATCSSAGAASTGIRRDARPRAIR